MTRRNWTYAAGVIAALLAGFLLGRLCNRSAFVPPDTGPALVSYRGGSAGLSAVKEAIANEPTALRSPKAARGVVEELVRARILAGLAIEKGYDRDPQLSLRYAEQLANLYLEREFEAGERSKAPTDDEVKAFFEAHRSELNRPERIRLGVILLRAATPAEKAGKRTRAQAVLAEARAREADYYAFSELARKRSEDPRTAAHQGALPFMTREEVTAALGPEAAEAAFAMPEPGKVRPTVVEGRDGYYVLKLLGREAAQEPSFEAVRDGLRVRLTGERREERRQAFLDQIWKRAEVKFDEALLDRLVAEVRAARR